MKDVPIVKAATAYDASNGEVYILVMNQALYLGEHMEHSLLCPNQARSNGIIVNDVPKHLALTITDTTHSIVFPEDDVTLPLELQGVISKITIRLPTIEEIENCRWLTLTSATEWDPNDPTFMEQECNVQMHQDLPLPDRIIFAFSSVDSEYDPFLNHDMFRALYNTRKVSYTDACQILSTTTTKRNSAITAHELAARWGIGLTSIEQTLRVTTQKGIRNAIHPIHCRYRTKQAQLRYNQLGEAWTVLHRYILFRRQVHQTKPDGTNLLK